MFLISGDSSAISRTWLPRLVETHEREVCMEVLVPVSTPIQQAGFLLLFSRLETQLLAEQAGKCCPTMATSRKKRAHEFW